MSQHLPFRLPCGEAMPDCLDASRHARAGDDAIPLYVNTTEVPNWDGGGEIPPYQRCVLPNEGHCGPCDGECADDVPSGYWTLPYPTNTFGTVAVNVEVTGPVVAGQKVGGSSAPYSTTKTPIYGIAQANVAAGITSSISVQRTVDMQVCKKTGWKGVLGRRNWHGIFGPLAEGNENYLNGCGCPGAYYVLYELYRSAPEATKYLTVEYSGSQSFEGDSSLDSSGTITVSVDPHSGVLSATSSFTPDSGYLNNSISGMMAYCQYTLSNALASLASEFNIGECCADESCDASGQSWSWTNGNTLTYDGVGTVDFTYYLDDFPATQTIIAITDTSVTVTLYTYVYFEEGDPLYSTFIYSANYSNPIESSEVVSDVQDLLGEWDMADDREYPWRGDAFLTALPMVGRSEPGTGVQPLIASLPIINDMTNPQYMDPPTDSIIMPNPAWEFSSSGQIIQPDPNGTSSIQSYPMAVGNGESLEGEQISFPTNMTSWSWAGSLPPGITLDSSGAFHGTVDGSSWPSDWGGNANYGIMVYITLTPLYDGSIVGAPLPAGYQNYFDFSQRDHRFCCADFEDTEAVTDCDTLSGQNVTQFNSVYGAGIPLNATKWTNIADSLTLLPYASIGYVGPESSPSGCGGITLPTGGFVPNGLVAVKYAEIIDVWPSQNFARPAGNDKFIFDELKVYGCYDFDGSKFTPYSWSGVALVAVTSGVDTSGIWGGSAVGGFGTITFDGTYIHFTKTMNLPNGWQSASGDTDFCFGKLRYPGYPAILGRDSVTAIADSMGHPPLSGSWTPTYQFGSNQVNYGLGVSSPTESLDFYDINMTFIVTQTATRVSDTVFTTTVAMSGAAFVMIHGNPAQWYMNDSSTKGDFATLEWLWDWRTNGEYGRLAGETDCDGSHPSGPASENYEFASFTASAHCLPFNSCAPKVCYFGFDEEDFENAVFVAMPDDFVIDERYGSRWQGMVVPVMTDIFWTQPHRPFGNSGDPFDPESGPYPFEWTMDNGTCQESTGEDGIIYYAHEPQVECVLALPSNYGPLQNQTPPTPPADTESLGFASPVTSADGQQPPNAPGINVALGADGFPNGVNTAFFLHGLFCENAGCEEFQYQYPGC